MTSRPKRSSQMDRLYGESYSKAVYERLENLDPDLNDLIQEVAYDQFWGRKGLSTRDKSFATVAALVAMGRTEQTNIHMNGFLNAGGTEDELKSLLLHLIVYCGFPASMSAFDAYREVVDSRSSEFSE